MTQISHLLALSAFFLLGIITLTNAHPGEHHDKLEVLREMKVRSFAATKQSELLGTCQGSAESRALKERAFARRAAKLQQLRDERGVVDEPFVHRRTLQQFKNWEQVKHDKTGVLNYDTSTPSSVIFGANTSCILTPDNANGPYFVLGEKIRSNVVESQQGIPLHLELQFVDVRTCKPVKDLMVDIWSCNSTGVYSGVSAAGQGGLQSTWLRGVQVTNSEGVVNFDTLFPGHYSGRATHTHLLTHSGATLNYNGTYSGGHISHLSQIFYDQSLINSVESLSPYNQNRIAKTLNDNDGFTGYSATAAYDPFPEYVVVGNSLTKGIFAWMEVGIDVANNFDNYGTNAAYVDSKGGHDNPKFNMGIVGNPPPTHG